MTEVFHFSGHTLTDGDDTGLVLQYPDSLFLASSLKGISLRRCRLAVLATCSSAGRTEYGMEDTSNLAHALLTAGALNVVATLWDVDSQASRIMMLQFYASLTQSSPVPLAMQAAQLQRCGPIQHGSTRFFGPQCRCTVSNYVNAIGEEHMEMTSETSTVGLPPKHFAILFEGAWLFRPDPNDPTRILAACPLEDSGHKCKFGLWNRQTQKVEHLPKMKLEMTNPSHYSVDVNGFEPPPYKSFADLFSAAARKYNFVYLARRASLAGERPDISFSLTDKSKEKTMRSVSVPMPTSLRADGAMATAEIGGLGIGNVFEPSKNVKRPFVTFLFVYEYSNTSASATVNAQRKHAVIQVLEGKAAPHLIFNVHPVKMNGHGDMDASAEMVHAVTTFETLRSCVSMSGKSGSPSLCNIALYHGRGMPEFLCGDSGLDPY